MRFFVDLTIKEEKIFLLGKISDKRAAMITITTPKMTSKIKTSFPEKEGNAFNKLIKRYKNIFF